MASNSKNPHHEHLRHSYSYLVTNLVYQTAPQASTLSKRFLIKILLLKKTPPFPSNGTLEVKNHIKQEEQRSNQYYRAGSQIVMKTRQFRALVSYTSLFRIRYPR